MQRGTLPAELRPVRIGRLWFVEINDPRPQPLCIGYARVSSSDQKAQLDGQKLRLLEWAQRQGWILDDLVIETGSGLNGARRKLLRVLQNPDLGWLVVEHRDRLARFGFDMVDALLRAGGGGVVVLDDSEVDGDLVRDVTEVLTSMCARLYGRRSARRRALRALEAAGS